jgi:hypothetical protein
MALQPIDRSAVATTKAVASCVNVLMSMFDLGRDSTTASPPLIELYPLPHERRLHRRWLEMLISNRIQLDIQHPTTRRFVPLSVFAQRICA